MAILRRLVHAAAFVVEELIEAIGSGESRADLHERIRRAASRGAELSLQLDRLRQEDRDHMVALSLYRNEVEELGDAIQMRFYPALQRLRGRTEHLPFTEQEFEETVMTAIHGHSTDEWDPSEGEDRYEGSFREAADDEGVRLAHDFYTKDKG